MGDWTDKWKRSPSRDRRVVVDGKFVELAPLPKTDIEQPIDAVAEGYELSIGYRDFVPPSDCVVVLDAEDSKVFAEALLNPPAANEVLKTAGSLISYPTGSLGEHVSLSEQLQAELEPLPVGSDGNYSAFDLDGPEHKQSSEELRTQMAELMFKEMHDRVRAVLLRPVGERVFEEEKNETITGTSTGTDVLPNEDDGPDEGVNQPDESHVRETVRGEEEAALPASDDSVSATEDLDRMSDDFDKP